MKGFVYIKETARDNTKSSRQYKLLHMMIQRWLKQTVGDFFTRWKASNLKMITETFEGANKENQETEEHFR